MFNRKFKLLVPITLALATGSTEVNATLFTSHGSLKNLTVFSNTYTTTGDAAIVYGNMLVGDVATTGANAGVTGNIDSVNAANVGGGTSSVGGSVASGGVMTVGGAINATGPGPKITGSLTSTGASTIGAYAQVLGNMLSGGIATTGANAIVGGSLQGATVVESASATSGSSTTTATAVSATLDTDLKTKALAAAGEVSVIRGYLNSLTTPPANALAATMTIDTTLNAGVYSAASFSTTASTILTLDAQGNDDAEFIFNITDILAIGASTDIFIINQGAKNNAKVVWNTGGYASIGASADFIGTVFAKTYISVGANSNVTSGSNACAGVYSQTSYVSTGADATINGTGCAVGEDKIDAEEVPEPFGILLSGLAALGFVTRRKILATRVS